MIVDEYPQVITVLSRFSLSLLGFSSSFAAAGLFNKVVIISVDAR
jgi:hypothetical protein